MLSRLIPLTLAPALAVAWPALAQEPAQGGNAPAIVDSDPAFSSSRIVDESALRYYASQKQTARVKAEIARLKRLYPGWTEPTDLDSIQPSPPEEAVLWDLFSAGRLDDLERAMAARRRADPAWRPSEELDRKFKRALFARRLRDANASGRPADVVALYRADPTGLDPSDVEAVWSVADALASIGQGDAAFDLYRSVLETSRDPGQRLATIQKALGKLSLADAEKLYAMGRPGPDGASEFASAATALTRARLAAFLHDEPAAEPSQADFSAYQAEVRRLNTVDQQSLVAWYLYKKRRFREALDWFKLAIGNRGDAMVAHGLAHTLRELGQDREAEEVAYAWRDGFVGNAVLFVDLLEAKLTQRNPPFVEAQRLERLSRLVLATNSGEGAQALGWYAYNSCQFDAAVEWFRRGVAWLPKEATVFGLALTFQRLRRQRDMLDLVNRYDGLFPSVVDLVIRDPAREQQPDPCGAAPPASVARAPEPAEPRREARGRPDPRRGAGAQVQSPELIARSEFPLAVPYGNPFRFPSPGTPRDVSIPGPYLREAPSTAPVPLVARRVPGADAMPYERLGFGLLPGYDGSDAVRPLQSPPPGTIWREEQTDRAAPSGRSSSNGAAIFDPPVARSLTGAPLLTSSTRRMP